MKRDIPNRSVIKAVAFVVLVQALAWGMTLLLMPQIGTVAPQPISVTSPAFQSALLYVVGLIVVISVMTMVLVILNHRKRILLWLFTAYLAFILFFESIYLLAGILPDLATLAVSVGLAAYAVYTVAKKRNSLMITGIISALIASAWVASEPYFVVLLLPLLLAVYDLYTVFAGPLKYLVSSSATPSEVREKEANDPEARKRNYGIMDILASRIDALYLGLGDTIVYSVMVSFAFLYFGIIEALAVAVAINFGVVLTLKLLQRRGALPALPISVGLALLVLVPVLL